MDSSSCKTGVYNVPCKPACMDTSAWMDIGNISVYSVGNYCGKSSDWRTILEDPFDRDNCRKDKPLIFIIGFVGKFNPKN